MEYVNELFEPKPRNEIEEEARYLMYKDFAVIPLDGKRPLTEHGLHDWTKSPATLTGWLDRWPNMNIGIVCGAPSGGLIVFDCDRHGDTDGIESLKAFEREHGQLPETVMAMTGSGDHFYYYATEEVRPCVNTDLGIDIRGEGSYVVAPPSVHPNGKQYEWTISPFDMKPARVDSLVMEFIEYVRPKPSAAVKVRPHVHGGGAAGSVWEPYEVPYHVSEGGRNDAIFHYGCSLLAKGFDASTITAALDDFNLKVCDPPLSTNEVARIAASVLSHPAGHSAAFDAAHARPARMSMADLFADAGI